uniref:Uncharacterized protein isoform X1 n=1 Tax=Nicotiana tabacum TaxID=4097 RepID=A0A1S3YA54_TOBAC|nr:PREDICTED: uncharacterized protein LOC107773972 isoform X1 [Nicotiana tabacum]
MTQFSCIFRLDIYIHDYLVKKGMNTTAEALAREANVNPRQAAVNSPVGFLAEWWDVFYDIFNSNQAEHAQEPNAEVPRTMDNVVPYTPSGFNPDSKIKMQEQGNNFMLPDKEVTSKLRILEVDEASHRVPSATASSPPVQQMPNMPQQWEVRDETSGIYFGRTKQMDPNPCGPTTALLPTTESSDAGSSTGSCS